jgi:hypothetical protein
MDREQTGVVDEAWFAAVAGASIGIAQWLVLRRQVSRSGWWVLLSSLGFAVGWLVDVETTGVVGDASTGVMVGASVGIAQWLVLRRQVSQAGWWVLASSVGFTVTFAVLAAGVLPGVGITFGVFAAYGAVTGAVLVWLLRQPVVAEQSHPQALLDPTTDIQIPKSETPGRKRLEEIAVLAVLIGLGLYVVLFGSIFRIGVEDKDEWAAVIDAFMLAMVKKDPDRAFALYSKELQDVSSVLETEEFLSDQWFFMFEGYLEVEISEPDTSFTRDGKFAELRADITYEGGYIGTFDATLGEEGGDWKILAWNVNVPKEKIDEYEARNQ